MRHEFLHEPEPRRATLLSPAERHLRESSTPTFHPKSAFPRANDTKKRVSRALVHTTTNTFDILCNCMITQHFPDFPRLSPCRSRPPNHPQTHPKLSTM